MTTDVFDYEVYYDGYRDEIRVHSMVSDFIKDTVKNLFKTCPELRYPKDNNYILYNIYLITKHLENVINLEKEYMLSLEI